MKKIISFLVTLMCVLSTQAYIVSLTEWEISVDNHAINVMVVGDYHKKNEIDVAHYAELKKIVDARIPTVLEALPGTNGDPRGDLINKVRALVDDSDNLNCADMRDGHINTYGALRRYVQNYEKHKGFMTQSQAIDCFASTHEDVLFTGADYLECFVEKINSLQLNNNEKHDIELLYRNELNWLLQYLDNDLGQPFVNACKSYFEQNPDSWTLPLFECSMALADYGFLQALENEIDGVIAQQNSQGKIVVYLGNNHAQKINTFLHKCNARPIAYHDAQVVDNAYVPLDLVDVRFAVQQLV